MALVTNSLGHTVPLTRGQIGPGEELNIDTTGAYESALIAAGVLVVVDPSVPPPEPAEPFALAPRRVFVASTQPSDLQRGDVWLQPVNSDLKVWVNE